MRISDWSSDVCSSDLFHHQPVAGARRRRARERAPPQAVERRARCAAGRRHLSQAELPRRRAAGDEFDDPYRPADDRRSEEHTSELQSLMRISYAVFCLKKKRYILNVST